MKKVYLLLLAAIAVLIIATSTFLHSQFPNHDTSFIYSVTSSSVSVKTTYDPEQALQVAKYIDSCLQPQVIFGNNVKIDKEITLNNGRLLYHIKGAPGNLKITAPKESNDSQSISKLKSIFEGLKSVIKPT